VKSLEYYLIISFTALLFIFRLVVVITTVLGIKFSVVSFSVVGELILLVLTLLSLVLMVKVKFLGALIFLVSSLMYYVPNLIDSFKNFSEVTSTLEGNIQLVSSVIAVIIPTFAFFIILVTKKQQINPVNKKTDFFYKNENYDRNLDDRADKNNYRIY